MPRNSIDVASRVSPHLSALLNSRINNPECEQAVTLMAVRRFLGDLLPADFNEAERMHHFDVIEELGATVLAVDFAQVNASEPLSRAIERLVNDENSENPPTLATVRNSLLGSRVPGWRAMTHWKTTKTIRCWRRSSR
ncbi:MAG: hypothetical protein K0M39_09045 [Rhizobium sp.]|nr:hypothetical protein [Rhizobium sp.]